MTQELIDEVVNAFGDAAEMAMIGGCDMVTVQGGHGWLLNQFLSPNTNRRTDRYGGSIENRARIYIEVAENIRRKCGPGFGIDFRLSGMDFMENGATLEDVIALAKMLDPSWTCCTSRRPASTAARQRPHVPVMFLPRGCNGYLAAEIKKHVHVPVVTVGGYGDPAQMSGCWRKAWLTVSL
jgi:2,4-dienoyl-CoA reductase-like NADH-dependent reductase (Old Yellow Enzyme family)